MASGADRRVLAIGLGLATVAVAGVAAASGNPVSTKPYIASAESGLPPPTPATQPPGAVLPPPSNEPPAWLHWVLEGFVWLCITAIAATFIVLVVRLLVGRPSDLIRRRVLEPDEIQVLTAPSSEIDLLGRERDLQDAVTAGIAALAEGRDVRAGIITAWLHLEDAAAEAGTPRRDDDAPGDLVTRILAEHDLRPRRLQALAELYRRARFSAAELDDRDRDDAQRALRDVRDDLTRGTPAAAIGPWAGGQAGASGERWPTRWT